MPMPEGMSFDQLNRLYADGRAGRMRSMPYEKYFGEMDLTEEQKEKRIDTADRMEEIFIGALALIFYMWQYGAVDTGAVASLTESQYRALLAQGDIGASEDFLAHHIPETVAGIVNTTVSDPDNAFNFSLDRAMLIAENESNDVWNNAEFAEAVEAGKTTKTWSAIIDRRTRDTHRDLDGVTKPIMEPFEVGEYLMQYPTDESYGAGMEEIANCRCSVRYS